MNKRHILAGSFIIVLVAAIFAGVYAQAQHQSGQPRTPIQGTAPRAEGGLPEHVFYEHLFKSLLALKNTADYRAQAGLDEREAAEFASIAADCARELAQKDAKAQIVIKDFRAKIKRLKRGEALPAPPQKLKEMQAERDALILRHAQRLQQSLGFEKFNRINEAGRHIVHIEIRPAR